MASERGKVLVSGNFGKAESSTSRFFCALPGTSVHRMSKVQCLPSSRPISRSDLEHGQASVVDLAGTSRGSTSAGGCRATFLAMAVAAVGKACAQKI
jgi:hypothetical protein